MATKVGMNSIVTMIVMIIIIMIAAIPIGIIFSLFTFGIGGLFMPLLMYIAMGAVSMHLTKRSYDTTPWILWNIIWPFIWIWRIFAGQMPGEK